MKLILILFISLQSYAVFAAEKWLEFKGAEGLPGNGKKIVLISGEPEYRSEEVVPMLGKLLAERHGFDCKVLFAINPETGFIDPTCQTNIPGMHFLDEADLAIIFIRFRRLPPEQNVHFKKYFASGKPMIGLRTTTHGWKDEEFKQVGGTAFGGWGGHHGHHKVQGTRGIINEEQKEHPVNIGVKDIFGKSDVYGFTHEKLKQLGGTALVLGQVLETLEPDSKPVTEGADKRGQLRNNPMLPVVWTHEFKWPDGSVSPILVTTMGASVDFVHEGLRRIMVNGSYWLLGLEDKITPELDCSTVGEYTPTMYKTYSKPKQWHEKQLTPNSFR